MFSFLRMACYLSDDGASMLTFEALTETANFARAWVPFCKKYNIEPRAPEMYFSQVRKKEAEDLQYRTHRIVSSPRPL